VSEPLGVLIVRHAIAEARDAARWPDDSLRPLTRHGIRRFKRSLGGIAALMDQVDQSWASPLLRARLTARLGTEGGVWPEPTVTDVLKPEEDPEALGRTLQACRNQASPPTTIALIGHEPGLGRFLAWCLGATPTGSLVLRKGGAALLCFDGQVKSGGASLTWFATPKMLRSMRREQR
jgi:phosphohistidine phosphatase